MRKSKIISIDRIVLTSFIVDLSDVLISLLGVVLTGSVTMISQTLEGFSDIFSSGLLLFGNKRSKLPSDEIHPYGYGRETFFWALMSGLITFSVTATISIYLGYQRFLHPEAIKNLSFAMFALIFSIFSNGYSCFISYKKLAGKHKASTMLQTFLNSPLIEVKTSFILDLMGTVAAIFGLLAMVIYKYTSDLRFDGIGAILTGLALAFFAYFILVGAKDLLIGRSASKAVIKKIMDAVMSFEQVTTIMDIRTLVIGTRKILINLEINVIDDLNTPELEKLIDRIEEEINRSVEITSFIQIELETEK